MIDATTIKYKKSRVASTHFLTPKLNFLGSHFPMSVMYNRREA